MDPCDLRLLLGVGVLCVLVVCCFLLFVFVFRTALADHDLENADGRVAALRRCVPMVALIKDPTLRDEYARQLAGWVGWDDVAQVIDRVREHAKKSKAHVRNDFGPNAPRSPAPQRREAAPAR